LEEILNILLVEVDFLVDDKMRENLENAPIKQSIQDKLDIVKKCLNIDSIDEMIMLVEEFVYHCRIKPHDENMLESNGQGS
jgi:dynein regulatory complex protein 1